MAVASLRRTPLFRGLSDDQLRGVAGQAQLLQLEPGEELIRQGEVPAGLTVVVAGELRVLQVSERSPEPYEVARFAPFGQRPRWRVDGEMREIGGCS